MALHPGGVLEPEDLADDVPSTGAVCHLSSLPWKEALERYLASFERSYAEAGVDRKTFYALLKRDRDPPAGE